MVKKHVPRMVAHRLRRQSLGIAPITVDVPQNQRELIVASVAIAREEYMYEVASSGATLLPVVTILAAMRRANKLPTDRELSGLGTVLGEEFRDLVSNAKAALKTHYAESEQTALLSREGGVKATRQLARTITATRVATAHINYLKATVKYRMSDWDMLGPDADTVFGLV